MNSDDYFEQLWTRYPNDLCRGKKGAKKVARESWNKIFKDGFDPKEAERIIHLTKVGASHCRSDPKPDRWAFVSTYLNQGRYDDVLEYAGKPETIKTEAKSCEVCGKPSHGAAYRYCTDCTYQFEVDTWKETRKQSLEKLGLYQPGMSQKELSEKCREYLRTSGLSGSFSTLIQEGS